MVLIDDLSNNSGIYFLYENDSLLYVGMARNIKTRIKNHYSVNCRILNHSNPSDIDRVIHRVNRIEFEEYPYEDLLWIEMFFICKLKPLLNNQTRRSYPMLDEYLNAEGRYERDKLNQYWKRIANKDQV